jgi:hypothetical protein
MNIFVVYSKEAGVISVHSRRIEAERAREDASKKTSPDIPNDEKVFITAKVLQ